MKLLLAFLCCILSVTGCATPSYRQAALTTTRMDETSRSLMRAGREIDNTVSALVNLQGKSGVDLRNQYLAFMRRVNELEKQERRVAARQNKLEAASRKYFSSWEDDLRRFRSAELKQKSRERRRAAIDNFDRMFDGLQVQDEAYRRILYDLEDIRRFLSYDLSQQSVDAIKDNIKRVTDDAAVVRSKIDEAVRELQGTTAPLPSETQSPSPSTQSQPQNQTQP